MGGFRSLTTAAPLKLHTVVYRCQVVERFRSLTTAAPLKPCQQAQ